MATKVLSVFFVPADMVGSGEARDCEVCGMRMGSTLEVCAGGFAEAMAGRKSRYRVHRCPHSEAEWHKQAEDIKCESQQTCSPALKKLLDGDVAQICKDGLGSERKGKIGARRKGNVKG
jgi:hypothetical protein